MANSVQSSVGVTEPPDIPATRERHENRRSSRSASDVALQPVPLADELDGGRDLDVRQPAGGNEPASFREHAAHLGESLRRRADRCSVHQAVEPECLPGPHERTLRTREPSGLDVAEHPYPVRRVGTDRIRGLVQLVGQRRTTPHLGHDVVQEAPERIGPVSPVVVEQRATRPGALRDRARGEVGERDTRVHRAGARVVLEGELDRSRDDASTGGVACRHPARSVRARRVHARRVHARSGRHRPGGSPRPGWAPAGTASAGVGSSAADTTACTTSDTSETSPGRADPTGSPCATSGRG